MNLRLSDRTLIMGILNVTPDSFFDGGRYRLTDSAVRRAEEMLEEGADIIDIGGESTRPGSEPISLEEEMDRVIPVFEKLRGFQIPLSIDTYKAKVAEEACKLGASVINDISGLQYDQRILEVAKEYGTHLIIMHIKGTPRNMQDNPYYSDVVQEVSSFLQSQAYLAEKSGFPGEKIILDPGIGFGKTLEHNILILRNIEKFKDLGFPLLVGHSRKSMIGRLLGDRPPEERLFGTLAISAYLILKKVNILRVHDVKANVELRKVLEAL